MWACRFLELSGTIELQYHGTLTVVGRTGGARGFRRLSDAPGLWVRYATKGVDGYGFDSERQAASAVLCRSDE